MFREYGDIINLFKSEKIMKLELNYFLNIFKILLKILEIATAAGGNISAAHFLCLFKNDSL